MKLDELLNPDDLAAAIAAGHVRTQDHPTEPLQVFNYTEACVFERAWTPVTRQCRGLIVNHYTGEVVARPFEKAHNHDEPEAHQFEPDEEVLVLDKVDGSLGIVYPVSDREHAIATRGSFASDQALHATQVWQQRYAGRVVVPFAITPLFEIVYPENRIVVDYGGTDDLVLLGGIQLYSGCYVTPAVMAEMMRWDGPVAQSYPFRTFADVLGAPQEDGREGYVIRSVRGQHAVKYKFAEYVRLHKIVTGLNARGVWEALVDGRTVEQVCADLPDEFHQWVRDVAGTLQRQVDGLIAAVTAQHGAILAQLAEGWTRKDYALIAKQSPVAAYLFALLDGRDITGQAWKDARPEAGWTPSNAPVAD